MGNFIQKYGGFLILLIGLLFVIYFGYTNQQAETQVITQIDTTESTTTTGNTVIVDIRGAVLNPGVYEVSESLRIYEVIELAGGLLETADIDDLNLSEQIEDSMLLIIPYAEGAVKDSMFQVFIGGEVVSPGQYYVTEEVTLRELVQLAGGFLEDADQTNLIFDMKMFEGFSITIPVAETSHAGIVNGIVNINYAALDELMTLDYIGVILGQRIIDYRSENGFFESIEDIMNVSGIGDSIYDEIKDDITV